MFNIAGTFASPIYRYCILESETSIPEMTKGNTGKMLTANSEVTHPDLVVPLHSD